MRRPRTEAEDERRAQRYLRSHCVYCGARTRRLMPGCEFTCWCKACQKLVEQGLLK